MEKEKEMSSFALEILQDYKKQNKRLFLIWTITFLAFVGLICYTVYLLNDIGTITTEEYDQEVSDVEVIKNSTITNGGK